MRDPVPLGDPAAWTLDLSGGRPRLHVLGRPTPIDLRIERVGQPGEIPLLRICLLLPPGDPDRGPGDLDGRPLVALLHDGSWREEHMARRAVAAAQAAASPQGRRRSAALRAACRLHLPEPSYPGQSWALEGLDITDPDLDVVLCRPEIEEDRIGDVLVPPPAGGIFWGAAAAGWLQGRIADDRPASAHDRQRLRLAAAGLDAPAA